VLPPGDTDLRTLLNDPAKKPTDLIVISHGWNNDMAEAERLYSELFANVAALLKEGKPSGLGGRRFAVVGVLWPSKKFADSELIPGNAAGVRDSVDVAALSAQLDTMKGGFDSPKEAETLQAMKALLPKLKNSDTAWEDFVKLARSLVKQGKDDSGEGTDRFFSDPPSRCSKNWSSLSPYPPPPCQAAQVAPLPASVKPPSAWATSSAGSALPPETCSTSPPTTRCRNGQAWWAASA
jgi:hypothetical protein